MKNQNELYEKILNGSRITPEEAVLLFDWDLIDLGRAADARMHAAFPGNEVGFIIDRIINFTNVCEASCAFCAFHAQANRIEPYELSMDEILKRVEELKEAGGSQVMLQGGLHPGYTIDNYVNMTALVKEKFPDIILHSFSPAEVVHLSKKSSLSINEIIKQLKNSGLDSMPGASDLLVQRIREKVSPGKITVKEWCAVINSLAEHNMKSSATMTYGMGETVEEKIKHLTVIRDVQDRAGNIRAFIPWSFSPGNTNLKNIHQATGIEYLQIVAIGRIFLDNVTYFQAGWLTEGLKLAQIALTMGANDMGGVLMEEVVVKATGIETRTNIDELADIIRNAGKIPVLRDSKYHVIRSV